MHRIYEMKNKLIEEARNRMENMDGGSIEQMGQIIDMIKDLSEAEKACFEADYYESVVEAMEGDEDRYGYDGGSVQIGRSMRDGRYGYDDGYQKNDRMGYRNAQGQYAKRPTRRRMRRSGYSEESVENIREIMQSADPERKKQLKQDLQEIMQEM